MFANVSKSLLSHDNHVTHPKCKLNVNQGTELGNCTECSLSAIVTNMENDQQPIETEGTSTTLTEKTEDEHGEHQLEQAVGDTEENQTGTCETTEDDSKEDEEDPDAKTGTNTEKAATVSAQASTMKSALAKKEERLKRLRELHLRRVHDLLLCSR